VIIGTVKYLRSPGNSFSIVILDDGREVFVNDRMVEGPTDPTGQTVDTPGKQLQPNERVEVLLADDPDLPNNRAEYARGFDPESIARVLGVKFIAGLVRRIPEAAG
jgi:hypothetical protein